MQRSAYLVSCCALLGLAGCVTIENDSPRALASAMLMRSDGAPAGVAQLTRDGSELTLSVDARGLSPGLHGMHIHAVGRCDRPEFLSAQGHWNPAERAHGSANPAGAHAGDLPNLVVGADGRGTGKFRLDPSSLAVGLAGLLDADGAAIVIHAAADDLHSDPSGKSGARVVCGVLAPG